MTKGAETKVKESNARKCMEKGKELGLGKLPLECRMG